MAFLDGSLLLSPQTRPGLPAPEAHVLHPPSRASGPHSHTSAPHRSAASPRPCTPPAHQLGPLFCHPQCTDPCPRFLSAWPHASGKPHPLPWWPLWGALSPCPCVPELFPLMPSNTQLPPPSLDDFIISTPLVFYLSKCFTKIIYIQKSAQILSV